jgi:hypothetical protein
MKRTKGGAVSPEQRDWHSHLLAIGHKVIDGRGFEDAKKKILELGFVPTKVTGHKG